MGKAISEEELRKLYEEVEPLFPKDYVRRPPEMSGNDRLFSNDGFAIGLYCVMINEKYPELLDVGLHPHILPRKEGFTRQDAKDWLIDKARFAIQQEKEEEKEAKVRSSKTRKNLVIALMLFLAFTIHLAWINGPISWMLPIKIIAFYVGTIVIGLIPGAGVMWLLHLVTGIPIEDHSRYLTCVDGVLKRDNEELGVAKVRSRISSVSLAIGIIATGIFLYVGLFTKFPMSFIGVYLFVTTGIF